jgi:hypothetical protein
MQTAKNTAAGPGLTMKLPLRQATRHESACAERRGKSSEWFRKYKMSSYFQTRPLYSKETATGTNTRAALHIEAKRKIPPRVEKCTPVIKHTAIPAQVRNVSSLTDFQLNQTHKHQ